MKGERSRKRRRAEFTRFLHRKNVRPRRRHRRRRRLRRRRSGEFGDAESEVSQFDDEIRVDETIPSRQITMHQMSAVGGEKGWHWQWHSQIHEDS